MSNLSFPTPNIPTPPNDPNLIQRWLSDLTNGLNQWFNQANLSLADYRLFAKVSRQTLAGGFVIIPNNVYVEMFASVDVTSDPVNPIANGVDAQLLILHNRSGHNVTIKDTLVTFLHGAVDYMMADKATLTLRWDGTEWVELAHSDN